MCKLVRIAKTADLMVLGRLASETVLRDFESGRLLAPQIEKLTGETWYPEDVAKALR
jgi:hypothetical protein